MPSAGPTRASPPTCTPSRRTRASDDQVIVSLHLPRHAGCVRAGRGTARPPRRSSPTRAPSTPTCRRGRRTSARRAPSRPPRATPLSPAAQGRRAARPAPRSAPRHPRRPRAGGPPAAPACRSGPAGVPAYASVASTGTGATVRPTSSSSSASSSIPNPRPPCSVGTATPSRPAAASLPQSLPVPARAGGVLGGPQRLGRHALAEHLGREVPDRLLLLAQCEVHGVSPPFSAWPSGGRGRTWR